MVNLLQPDCVCPKKLTSRSWSTVHVIVVQVFVAIRPVSSSRSNSSRSSMSDSDSDAPMDVEAAAEAALAGLLPSKSKPLYEGAFKRFEEWRMKNKIQVVDEKCMLAYFSQEMASFKPSTKWSHYSMLKTTINLNMGINISGFMNLISFLKRKADGYRPKKSKLFSKHEIFRFLREADDENFLAAKVVMIVGVYGACRREEILKLALEDIQDMDDSMRITIPTTKTKIMRQFLITQGNAPGVDMLQLFRKYAQMRPAEVKHSRFFLGYRKGLCLKQAMGINTVGAMPKVIAEFLKLPSPREYTGHCFRRSSASILADTGVDISVLKRHGGWKSATVAEGYVENSLQQKKQIAEKMFGGPSGNSGKKITTNDPPESQPSTSNVPNNQQRNFTVIPTVVPPPLVPPPLVPPQVAPPPVSSEPSASNASNAVQMNNLTNCTINFFQNR